MVNVLELVFQLVIGSEGTPLYDELEPSEPRKLNPVSPTALEELETPYYGHNKVPLRPTDRFLTT